MYIIYALVVWYSVNVFKSLCVFSMLLCRGDDKWDESSQSIYFTSRDPKKGLLLYKSNHPYTSATIFDPALGDHDAFQLVGRYMFAQHTDDDGVVSLYVSDQRKPFKEALIPSSLPHQRYTCTCT